MKDINGLYYYPFPQNKKIRMYVRQSKGIVNFRMWNADDEQMWAEHGWVPYGAVKAAMEMYDRKKGGFNPTAAYDLNAAKALLAEEETA